MCTRAVISADVNSRASVPPTNGVVNESRTVSIRKITKNRNAIKFFEFDRQFVDSAVHNIVTIRGIRKLELNPNNSTETSSACGRLDRNFYYLPTILFKTSQEHEYLN